MKELRNALKGFRVEPEKDRISGLQGDLIEKIPQMKKPPDSDLLKRI